MADVHVHAAVVVTGLADARAAVRLHKLPCEKQMWR